MKYFPIELDVQWPKTDPKLFEILKEIRPHWTPETVHIDFFGNGTVNKLMAVYHEKESHDKLLVRINGSGSSSFIDRRKEISFLKMLAEENFVAEILAEFANGLVYVYTPGHVLDNISVSRLPFYELIARHLARLHRTFAAQATAIGFRPMIWSKLEQFYAIVPDRFTDPKNQARFTHLFPNKTFFRTEIDLFRARLAACTNPIVFCHNDLLTYNIIYSPAEKTVRFIDYEFADYNYQAFDIGNHFGEFAGIDSLEFDRYPDENFRKNWIKIYLKEFNNNESYSNPEEVDNLSNLVNEFYLVSHLLWSLFALFQAEKSLHRGTDYLLIFERRIQDYFKRKSIWIK